MCTSAHCAAVSRPTSAIVVDEEDPPPPSAYAFCLPPPISFRSHVIPPRQAGGAFRIFVFSFAFWAILLAQLSLRARSCLSVRYTAASRNLVGLRGDGGVARKFGIGANYAPRPNFAHRMDSVAHRLFACTQKSDGRRCNARTAFAIAQVH